MITPDYLMEKYMIDRYRTHLTNGGDFINKKKFLKRILNNQKNVKFNDFTSLVESFGFILDHIDGSHHIFKHMMIREVLNLQRDKGEAKPYQIRQFINMVEKYNLKMED